jgi:precorrin-8X/cobalt-precorrin-8 methylmutase
MMTLRRRDDLPLEGCPPATGTPFAYLREPEAIYRRSFELIDAVTDWSGIPQALRPVAARMVHASGMPDLVADLAWSDDLVPRATAAVAAGATILCDCRMVRHGIIERLLPAANVVRCVLDDLPAEAPAGDTRSAHAIDRAAAELDGAVVVIGNAPTALFRLLERCSEERNRPAAILGLPVGFVGAAESKAALARLAPAPFLTLHGRRGGSAMAAAALNALALLARPAGDRP